MGVKKESMVQMESVIFFYPGQAGKLKWTEGANETFGEIQVLSCLENDCCICLSLQFWTIS